MIRVGRRGRRGWRLEPVRGQLCLRVLTPSSSPAPARCTVNLAAGCRSLLSEASSLGSELLLTVTVAFFLAF